MRFIPATRNALIASRICEIEPLNVTAAFMYKYVEQGIFKDLFHINIQRFIYFTFIFREIAAASGEWVNEFIPNNGKKKTSAKLYVPSTAELLKRNIKRSWTISSKF